SAGAVVMLPPAVHVHVINIVEYHHAQAQDQNLANVADEHRGVVPVGLQWPVPLTVFVAERKDVFTQNIAKKSKLESFVDRVCCDHDIPFPLDEKRMAALWERVKLNDG